MTPHPAKHPDRRSHKRVSTRRVVLGGGMGLAAVAGTVYLVVGLQCIHGTQSHVKQDDSLLWWGVHYVEDGLQRKDCADNAETSREAVLGWVGNDLQRVGNTLKRYYHMPKK